MERGRGGAKRGSVLLCSVAGTPAAEHDRLYASFNNNKHKSPTHTLTAVCHDSNHLYG
jgi:hypothetical protein